jgi:polyribonucleotide nucleotidyltransferase
MDFKVAGTSEFVTALQLDTKIDGIPADVLAQALRQAFDARMQILEVMLKAIPAARDTVGPTAPQIVSFEIPGDKIGEIIGPKGKTIRTIESETGADVSVDGDGAFGIVTVGARDASAMEAARSLIEQILNPPQPEIGKIYQGQVVNITKFGAFVNIMPGRDGLIHISKLGKGKRIDRVEDVLNLGDVLEVTVDDIDSNGKLSLSLVSEDPPDGGGGDGGDAVDAGSSNPPAAAASAARAASPTRGGDRDRGGDAPAGGGDRDLVSFEDWFDSRMTEVYGDLGPADAGVGAGSGGGGGRGGGGDRRPRRRRR